jgi:hypothetical protein
VVPIKAAVLLVVSLEVLKDEEQETGAGAEL